MDGTIVTAKSHLRDRPRAYPFIIDNGGVEYSYTEEGFFINPGNRHGLDIIEEIQEPKMKLEVGKKYRTVDGTIMTVKRTYPDEIYSFIVDDSGVERWYTKEGFYYQSKKPYELNIIEEIKENTMFNKGYKYLCMNADGYNMAFVTEPRIFKNVWLSDADVDVVVGKNFFNLGDDWKESLREIVYNDDGSIYLRKPRHEFKVDDKVLVRHCNSKGEGIWRKRHFSRWNPNGKPECFGNGATAYSADGTNIWDEIKPYEGEV